MAGCVLWPLGGLSQALGQVQVGRAWREAALPHSLPSTTASLSSICGTNSSGWPKKTGFSVDGLSAGCSRTNFGRGRDMAASGERQRAAGGFGRVRRPPGGVSACPGDRRQLAMCSHTLGQAGVHRGFRTPPQGRRTVVSISAIGQVARTSRAHQLPWSLQALRGAPRQGRHTAAAMEPRNVLGRWLHANPSQILHALSMQLR